MVKKNLLGRQDRLRERSRRRILSFCVLNVETKQNFNK